MEWIFTNLKDTNEKIVLLFFENWIKILYNNFVHKVEAHITNFITKNFEYFEQVAYI